MKWLSAPILLAVLGLGLVLTLKMRRSRMIWTPPLKAAPYLQQMDTAELAYGLPRGLLARQAYQESRFRSDIIEGRTKSSAGAVGLMQIVPRWHPGVDPLDPIGSIWYAAKYLRGLFDRFGSWELALAAYNWGPTNVAKHTPEQWPKETRDYVQQIGADVALS